MINASNCTHVRVSIYMCDNECDAFSTGIVKHGIFTKVQFEEKRYLKLIKDIDLLKDCHWSYNFIFFQFNCDEQDFISKIVEEIFNIY